MAEAKCHGDASNEYISLIKSCGIRVVAFGDMDQTAVAMHSRGCMERENLSEYLEKVTKDFSDIVPKLAAHGLNLAIATHSDEQEFVTGRKAGKISHLSHILGKELVCAVLRSCFSEDIVSDFFIVAHNPRAHNQLSDPHNFLKRKHMRELQRHFQVRAENILFFDDDKTIVNDCVEHCGVRAFKVDAKNGFQFQDLVEASNNLNETTRNLHS